MWREEGSPFQKWVTKIVSIKDLWANIVGKNSRAMCYHFKELVATYECLQFLKQLSLPQIVSEQCSAVVDYLSSSHWYSGLFLLSMEVHQFWLQKGGQHRKQIKLSSIGM